jgi:nicotinamide-nucleotide amidase
VGTRAGIVVTGTEVLTGRVADRNGPWLAEEFRRLGMDVGSVIVVGDRPEDLRRALDFLADGNDLVVTTGGLGPTADDLTARLVVPPAEGRTAPPVLVLPGPPSELQGMWPAALQAAPVRAVLSGATELRQETVRLRGTLEAQLAAFLRTHEDGLAGLEVTTCLRDGELEIVSRFAPAAQGTYDRLLALLRAEYARTLFSTGPTVDELVAGALSDQGLTVATGESCTGGLLAARLTARAGSSSYVLGGIASYANSAKERLVGVDPRLLATVGAVSAEVAVALADGVRERFGADVGVGITGIAGPGGGTPDKPVGTVHLCVAGPGGRLARAVVLPGSRAAVRERSVTLAMHLLRNLLLGGPEA